MKLGSLWLAALLLPLVTSSRAPAQVIDGGASSERAPAAPQKLLPFHSTLFIWDNSASTQSLGLGSEYQSRDPVYEMTFRLLPRYYFYENAARSFSVRGDGRLLREFTNSDTTTERGEWTFTDTEIWLAYVEALSRTPGRISDLLVRFPSLLLPTSKVSRDSGRVLGVAAGLGFDQGLTLRGPEQFLEKILLRPRATYTYQFADANVATRSGFDRVRLDPEGVSLPSDQTSGSALPQHLLTVSLRTDTTLLRKLVFINEFGMRYARRYALTADDRVCSPGGSCVEPLHASSPSRWDVLSIFYFGLYYAVTPSADIGVGYANLAGQLGPDGQRRNFFYSPDARVFLSLTLALSELYQEARGETPAEPLHTARATRGPAL